MFRGVKRPSSVVVKTSTAATGTCVIVAGKSSNHLIRAGTECYFCRVTLHVSGVKRPSSGLLYLLIRAGTALIRRCDDLPATIPHVTVAAVLVLNTPEDGRLTPETCRVTLQK
jgi:hypothetical protein